MYRKLNTLILFTVLAMLMGLVDMSPQHIYGQEQKEGQPVPTSSPQQERSPVESPYEILLRSRQFTPEIGLEPALAIQGKVGVASIEGERIHVLLQLYDIPEPESLTTLQSAGIELLNYIPRNAWFASIPAYRVAPTLESSQVAKLVRWAGTIRPADKVPLDVWAGQIGNWAIAEDGRVRLAVSFFDDVSLDVARQVISRHGGVVEGKVAISNKLLILLQPAEIPALAAQDTVRWLDQVPPPPVTHNDGSRGAVNVDAIQYASYELTGQGVTIGMWDSGAVDWNHDDFKRPDTSTRVTTRTGTITDHATHVAGTMAGNGARSQAEGGTALQWRGMAPGADIVSYDFNDPINDYLEIDTYGIDLSQNSWGEEIDAGNCEHYGDYRWHAPEFDRVVYKDRIPIIFSVGNERGEAHCPADKPYGNIVPPGGTAKNTIVVGAINSDDQSMTDFSSWGPVDDGRLKPEVVAPGCEAGGEGYIHSTLPGNTYGGTGWCGTSMAAPVVSGISALLIEHYRQIYGADPWPSTIKALLVHSAHDLDDPANNWYNPGPDYASGYGLVDAQAAADLVCTKAVTQDTVSNGKYHTFNIQVPTSTTQLKVTLAWDDPAAAENADPTLINDLDLILWPPSPGTYRPWVLDSSNPISDAVRTGKDYVNNLEQVLVTNPISGEWTIVVTGFSVPQGPQNYSLVSEALRNPIAAGLCYLRRTQEITGSWSSNVGITSLAALAFLNAAYDESDPAVSQAIQYILSHTQPDGSICADCARATYETSIAIMALKATHAITYTNVISSARDWLVNSQWDDDCTWGECPVNEDDWRWGGFGYGDGRRPDMSNSQFALLALDAADLAKTDLTWTKAVTFVSRSQNRTASNDGFLPGNDGGFVYCYSPTPPTSRGSMTGAGIWGLALAELSPVEPRFAAALDWVENNYSWDYHPLTDDSLGDANLYYYYLTMAKALSMARRATVMTNDGKMHDWYSELRIKLVSSQRQDGSWVNSNAGAWENNPDLVTAYSLLTLQTRELPPGADLEMVIILHSPADLHLYDAQGRHTGKNYETGGIDEDIPSSQYFVNASQTITITPPLAGNYHLEIAGTGEGGWQIEIIGTWNGAQISYDTYAGTITTGTVLAMDLNVGAFVGPLTIFSIQPTESPVMCVQPGTLNLTGQPGETLQAWFTIAETTRITVPIQRINILVPDLTDSAGVAIPIIITPTSVVTLSERVQTVNLTIPLTTNLSTGVYAGSVVVESVSSGAKAVQLMVNVFIPVGGRTFAWAPTLVAGQHVPGDTHTWEMIKPWSIIDPVTDVIDTVNYGCDAVIGRHLYLPVRIKSWQK